MQRGKFPPQASNYLKSYFMCMWRCNLSSLLFLLLYQQEVLLKVSGMKSLRLTFCTSVHLFRVLQPGYYFTLTSSAGGRKAVTARYRRLPGEAILLHLRHNKMLKFTVAMLLRVITVLLQNKKTNYALRFQWHLWFDYTVPQDVDFSEHVGEPNQEPHKQTVFANHQLEKLLFKRKNVIKE